MIIEGKDADWREKAVCCKGTKAIKKKTKHTKVWTYILLVTNNKPFAAIVRSYVVWEFHMSACIIENQDNKIVTVGATKVSVIP